MRIAVPTKNNCVDSHFGHCEFYTLFTLNESNQIENIEKFEAPVGCGCKSNVAEQLKEQGVELMLVGNIGQGAINKISEMGIKIIKGSTGDVFEVVDKYINNQLIDSGTTCSNHVCSH